MEMDGWQPGRFECGQPYLAPEVGVPQLLPGQADEDEPLVSCTHGQPLPFKSPSSAAA